MDTQRPTTEDPELHRSETKEPAWLAVKSGVTLPEKVATLRRKLYQKAKQEPRFRFYALYDRIYRLDVLLAAWDLVQKNKGAPGIDGISFQDIIDGPGVLEFCRGLAEELRTKSYKPQPVKRVYIPKPDGRKRPLGIPTIRDRVIQMAVLLVIEPIFESDFTDSSFGFRPQRNAGQAIERITEHLKQGCREVYDADLKGYFDTIPHDKLMACVERRISDGSVLKLIRSWLRAPIVERTDDGQERMTRPRRGTPQGGVLSPLLANLYLHWFEVAFHRQDGPAQWAKAKIVRYADDFVILARYQGRRLTDWVETMLEGRFGLTINRQKTRIVNLNTMGASFDFLGFTFRYDRDLQGRPWRYLNVFPSKKSAARARERLRELTGSSRCFVPLPRMIMDVENWFRSWSAYFSQVGYPKMAFREIRAYAIQRLTCHLKRRSQRPFRPPEGRSYYAHILALARDARQERRAGRL